MSQFNHGQQHLRPNFYRLILLPNVNEVKFYMKVKEFLNIAYKNFSYIEFETYNLKNGLIRYVFNWTSMQRASEYPDLIPLLDCDIYHIFYDKDKPMCINIGLYNDTSLAIPFSEPLIQTYFVKSYEEVEKIKGFIEDNHENSFLVVCFNLSNANITFLGDGSYTTEDSIYSYYITPNGGVKKEEIIRKFFTD